MNEWMNEWKKEKNNLYVMGMKWLIVYIKMWNSETEQTLMLLVLLFLLFCFVN
jgi:hypothetical protein